MAGALRDILELRDRAGGSYRMLVRDTVAVAVAVVVLGAFAGSGWVRAHVPATQMSVGLTVVASAVALVVAVLWMLVARITMDGRGAWASAALAVYGLVSVPATTLGSALESGRASTGAMRLTANAVVVLMLCICTVPAMRVVYVRGVRVRSFMLLLVGVSIPVAAGVLALLIPETALAVTSYLPIRLAVNAGWLLAAAMVAYRGLAADLSPSFRAGLGLLVVALAHTHRVLSEPAQPTALPNLAFSSVRLLGLLIVFSGSYELARRAVRGIRSAQMEHQDELMEVEHGLARRAELDHEIRNGIAGIAGAADVLRSSAATSEQVLLQTVVTTELTQLDALLAGRTAGRAPGTLTGYPAEGAR